MNKSCVALTHKVCPFCGKSHDENVQFSPNFEPLYEPGEDRIFTGYELCAREQSVSPLVVFFIPTKDGEHPSNGRRAAIRRELLPPMYTAPWYLMAQEDIDQLLEVFK